MATGENYVKQELVNCIRAKELYKYFRPRAFNTLSTSKSSSPDTVLTAHTQLVAWRLNMNRSLVSLIDRETQYFIAESTKTLHLDTGIADDPTDAIWAGCISVPKAGRLCECTLEALPSPTAAPPCFEIRDLTKDPRFNKLPFIAGGPKFRYYVGVPIKTKMGVAIGSLFAMDVKPREPVSDSNKQFMTLMAQNVMTHLEMMREREERTRATEMHMYLSAFVDPSNHTGKRKRGGYGHSKNHVQPTDAAVEATEIHRPVFAGKSIARPQQPSPWSSKHGSEEDSTVTDSDTTALPKDADHHETFRRAADLLFDSLSLRDGGGVVFMSDSSHDVSVSTMDRRGSYSSRLRDDHRSNVMASTTSDERTGLPTPEIGAPFTAMPPSVLTALIKRYPRGKIFTLDPESILTVSSSSDESGLPPDESKRSKGRELSKTDVRLLKSHFPTARQIVFVPIWDAISDCWSACLLYNCSDYRTVTTMESLYCIAFCNCITSEIARLAIVCADQQKQTFIGSISHELRSPLHGILGSMELLGDTDCTSFQTSLIDTANSCAITLLDTIQQILDFSKVNAIQRSVPSASRRAVTIKPGSAPWPDHQPSVHGLVNLALVTEEVIEGFATGQAFKTFAKPDEFEPMSLTARGRFLHRGQSPSRHDSGVNNSDLSSTPERRKDVKIILDISPRASWAFETRVGAFRRVVMNLFGNSLKYTQSGYIKVKLEEIGRSTSDFQEHENCSIIQLTVEDTGCGISPQFMKSKLFVPFSQDCSLNPGTGLGLSLIKQLVKLLSGEIKIHSTVDVGTEVIVQLPLSAGAAASNIGGSSDDGRDENVLAIRQLAGNRHVALFNAASLPEHDAWTKPSDVLRKSLVSYLTDWYGFASVVDWHAAIAADVIIVDEQNLRDVLASSQLETSASSPSLIVVLCTNSSRHASITAHAMHSNLEFTSIPLGPYKLAKSLKLGFDRLEALSAGIHPSSRPTMHQGGDDITESMTNVAIRNGERSALDVSNMQQYSLESLNTATERNGLIADEKALKTDDERSGYSDSAHIPTSVLSLSASGTQAHFLDQPTGLQSSAEINTTSSATMLRAEPTLAGLVSTSSATNLRSDVQALISRAPRLLLVDDNEINLRLINTFMQKRSYACVNLADDGEQAVNTFKQLIAQDPPQPPDIIFMDINMPVLDGFAAARQIRHVEQEVAASMSSSHTPPPPPALIVALTGLAGERDQSKAFVNGIDLFITKPVSFREVGRLLDEWTVNGGKSRDQAH